MAMLMVVGIFLSIVATPKDVFSSTYQSVIQVKYDKLLNTNEQKIIIVGGSSLAFGLNEAMLEEATGYKVVNLGLHAGFGHKFNAELAKGNINAGDIVLIAFEYEWMYPGKIDYLGVDLVMSGIDHRLEMYKHIPTDKYSEVLGNLFTHAKQKLGQTKAEGTYSRSSFDNEGRMILDRQTTSDMLLNYSEHVDYFGTISVEGEITEESAAYVRELKSYVEELGASIYFVAAPALKDAVICTDEDFRSYERQILEKTDVPYISDSISYIFPKELMYDTVYHCNNAGEAYRTELLIRDLAAVGISAQN